MIRIFLRVYSLIISPAIHLLVGPGQGCRYSPTCSQYAGEAIEEYGVFKGVFLASKRLLRCHPFSTAGFDPVPRRTNTARKQEK
ncbi:MAG: membrane protein insertion efficiency factor YidD [Bdellovibrionales bacterium RIFOXYD1_FULL_53_11]|nr:MAG: membrane protein insertion efficiency factor YidD [Bdellovibrionales bacterium RIFOXYD1_FULL_53_11]